MLAERNRIITQVVRTAFPKGGAIPAGADDVDTASSVESLLQKIPPGFSAGLTLLFFVFDSRFFVLAFAGRWKRFVELDADPLSTVQKRKYLEAWESNRFLLSVSQILRIIGSYGYYTKPQVYKTFGYSGPSEPNLPPWYNPGPGPALATRGVAQN